MIEGRDNTNHHEHFLSIFRNTEGKFEMLTDEKIGERQYRNIGMQRISNGRIYFDTNNWADDDPACCPSIKGKTSYVLVGNKLIEK